MFGNVREVPRDDDLPPVTTELVMHRVLTEALIEVLGPKKGMKLLHALSEKYEDVENMAAVIPIVDASRAVALSNSRRFAAAWFKKAAPHFLRKLP